LPSQVFIALKGERHDGHQFIPEAISTGSPIIVADHSDKSWPLSPQTALIQVRDTTQALIDLATWHRRRLTGKVIAVTGSCGKSSVKTMTASILRQFGPCTMAEKSYNNHIGVPLTLLQASPDDKTVVLELGTNHHGEIDRLGAITRPDIGVITCIKKCHLAGLGDKNGVKEAKAELISHIREGGTFVLNADDPLCMSLAPRFDGEVLTFGIDSPADVRCSNVKTVGCGQFFKAANMEFHIPVSGKHNVLNAAAAICIAKTLGASRQNMLLGLSHLRLPHLRSEIRTIGGVRYLLDCYNSNPAAMRAATEAFLEMPSEGNRIVVCGDMLELGDESHSLHVETGRMLAEKPLTTLIAVGQHGASVIEGWKEKATPQQKAFHVPEPDKAWMFVAELSKPGDSVLIKGSRKLELEQIPEAIAEYLNVNEKGEAA
jgi:UDP-N-acetylmuramoyl-tripeptide--D-alanyl-D-alanine ligase